MLIHVDKRKSSVAGNYQEPYVNCPTCSNEARKFGKDCKGKQCLKFNTLLPLYRFLTLVEQNIDLLVLSSSSTVLSALLKLQNKAN